MKLHIIPRIKGKIKTYVQKYGRKTFQYLEVSGLILMIFFIMWFKYSFTWKLFLVSIAIYFIYGEIMSDLKVLFRNFKG